MGFLEDQGRVLTYDESIKHHKYIKEHAIIQFLNLFKKFGHIQNKDDTFYWGDELEYQIVNIDKISGCPRIDLDIDNIFKNFISETVSIQFEYGRWMVETIPKNPYTTLDNPGPILANLKARRDEISSLFKDNNILYTAPVFPMLGVKDYYYIGANEEKDEKTLPQENDNSTSFEKNPYSNSQYLDDEIINTHPRYGALTRNIRLRRGEKVCIKVPIYQDINTTKIASTEEPFPGFIYMDAMGFGTGNCSLQITFSTKNSKEARYLTDQLAVFAPIFVILFYDYI